MALVGPRQAGKTTLARMLAGSYAEAVHIFDLESPADLARLANPELVGWIGSSGRSDLSRVQPVEV